MEWRIVCSRHDINSYKRRIIENVGGKIGRKIRRLRIKSRIGLRGEIRWLRIKGRGGIRRLRIKGRRENRRN